ncbi:hypothetical protein RvY_10661 [Ramazzottius varieornatus]|uniref:Timeless N-terminal domain-containing protein n=1 Tax=Ramazzottius varieornatus TaxID=947166 RepID=A0A1D1VDG9_RAMVA|nr:hypothetical protein RvY_10661 [Ramazzottius varieornatus]
MMEHTELSRIAYDPSRSLGEKIRGFGDEQLRREPVRATLGIARNLGQKLRLANPALANKPQVPDINKLEESELDLASLLKHLGTTIKGKYIKGPYCVLALKHILKRLNEDRNNERLTVRLHLVKSGVIQTSLIPLLLECPEDSELWGLSLMLLYELMISPAIVTSRMHRDRVEDSQHLKAALRDYDDKRQVAKKCFAEESGRTFFVLLCAHLKKVFALEEMHKDQIRFVGNTLRLLRNVFDMRGELSRSLDEQSPRVLHDNVFEAVHKAGLTAVLLWLSSADGQDDFVLDVLEVLHALLRDFDPEALGRLESSALDLPSSHAPLQAIREQDEAVRKANAMKTTSRHSTFGGSYTMKGTKAADPGKDMVVVKPISALLTNQFEVTAGKKAQNKGGKKKPVTAVAERVSAPTAVSEALRMFCVRFLQTSYNAFMHNAKSTIDGGSVEENDEHLTRYFWAQRFFMAFARVRNITVEYVSETISSEMFHFVLTNMERFSDMMLTDKANPTLWSSRTHVALRAYKELLMTLGGMATGSDEAIARAAKQIQSNVFYQPEYRDVFFKLLREFNEAKYTREYLKDLILTVHIFLKLLEVYLKKTSHLFVLKKARKPAGRTAKKSGTGRGKKSTKADLEARSKLWDNSLTKLTSILESADPLEQSVVPFDTASTVPVDDQTDVARRRIQMALLEKEPERAVALLRASKEVWQGLDAPFGTTGDKVDEDLKRLKDILLLELPEETVEEPTPQVDAEAIDDILNGTAEDGLNDVDGEEDANKKAAAFKEVEFEMESFLKRFASQAHVEPYRLLLREHVTNSFLVNHAILKMLHRIAVDLKLPGMLFQISLFRLYQKMVSGGLSEGDPRFLAELKQFMQFILGKFFERVREDPKNILAVLFWKNRNEALEIVEGPSEKPVPVKKPKGKADAVGGTGNNSEDAVRAGTMGRANGPASESSDEDEDVFSRLRNLETDEQDENDGSDDERPALVSDPPKSRTIKRLTSPEEFEIRKDLKRKRPRSKSPAPRAGSEVHNHESNSQNIDEEENRIEDIVNQISGKRRIVRKHFDDEDDEEGMLPKETSAAAQEDGNEDFDFSGLNNDTEALEEDDDVKAPVVSAKRQSTRKRFFDDDEESNSAVVNQPEIPKRTEKQKSPQKPVRVDFDSDEDDIVSPKHRKLIIDDDE